MRILDVSLPWGPRDVPWWRKWLWPNLQYYPGSPGWPCRQLLVGPLYLRLWWRGCGPIYNEDGALMSTFHHPEHLR